MSPWICPHCGTAYDAEPICPLCLTADELRAAIADVVTAYLELERSGEHAPNPEFVRVQRALLEQEQRLEAALRAVTGDEGHLSPAGVLATRRERMPRVSKVLRK